MLIVQFVRMQLSHQVSFLNHAFPQQSGPTTADICSVQYGLPLPLHWAQEPLALLNDCWGLLYNSYSKTCCLTCLPFACAIYRIRPGLNAQKIFSLSQKCMKEKSACQYSFSSMYIKEKKMKGRNRPRFSQLPLNADEPEGEQISLNFTIYFLLFTTLSSLLVQLKRTSFLVGCMTSILACV